MGAWGGGLYDSDFTRDLKATIDGVWKAPIGDDEVIAEIEQAHGLGHDGEHVDGFDYWLVLADQLERRGQPRSDIFDRAIAIIERGEDLRALEQLDAEPKSIAKRRKADAELLERLRNPRPAKQRRPLKAPQPLLFELGEAIAWPTDRGRFIAPWEPRFKQDGWGFGIVSDVGHLYGVLAYHAVQALKWRRPDRPSPEFAARCPRSEHFYGRITPEHVAEVKIERLGIVPDEALGPPLDPKTVDADRRKAALRDGGLPGAFGLDAFNNSVWPGPKFMFLAPSAETLDDGEPDQRPGMYDEDGEFPALPPDRPATRVHYYHLMRERMLAAEAGK